MAKMCGRMFGGAHRREVAGSPLQVSRTLGIRGWIIGRNVRVDYRWGAGNTDLFRKYATELVALAPDVILAPRPAW